MMLTITGYKIMIMRDSAEIMLQPESGRAVRLRFRADPEPQNVDTGTWLDADVEPSLFDNIVDVLRKERPETRIVLSEPANAQLVGSGPAQKRGAGGECWKQAAHQKACPMPI